MRPSRSISQSRCFRSRCRRTTGRSRRSDVCRVSGSLCTSPNNHRRRLHHWARELQQLGHTVRLLPAHDVHRYVRRSKTDRTDTKALLEADRNEEIHAVPVKTVEPQAIASLHRLRSAWLATRTARLNGLRGLLREFGIAIPVGARRVVPRVRELLVGPTPIPELMWPALAHACDEIAELEAKTEGGRAPAPRDRSHDADGCAAPDRAGRRVTHGDRAGGAGH